ncbi:hypothetical protein AAE478_003403 [Parahypoxylon ruwenzoriense]
MDDPWDWDLDRVVQELCSTDRSWETPAATSIFPPLKQQHEDSLREQEVDGHTLLTYDHTELCSELGIKILKHKATLKHAVGIFRSRSRKYRLDQKGDFTKLEAEHGETHRTVEDGRKEKLQRELASFNATIKNHSLPSQSAAIAAADETVDFDGIGRRKRLRAELASLDLSGVRDRSQPIVEAVSDPGQPGVPPPTPGSAAKQEPAQKKRRLAPTLISSDVDVNVTRNIPTEADVIMTYRLGDVEPSQESNDVVDLTQAYLGEDAFTRVDIMNDFSPTGEGGSDQENGVEFSQGSQVPYGRRLQVHQLFKRRLLRNRTPRQPRATRSDMVPGANNPEHDEVLPLYGDSDEEYDSETWGEIEAERAERAEADKQAGLSPDEVYAVIDEALQQFASDWRERKLPKLIHKANRIWRESRRFGLKASIDKHHRDLNTYTSRIDKYRGEIAVQQWRNVAELRGNTSILELSVADREYASWAISVIMSSAEPERLPPLPRSSIRRPRTRKSIPEGEEELTSESEGELSKFVIDDEPLPSAQLTHGPPLDMDQDDAVSSAREHFDDRRSSTPAAPVAPMLSNQAGMVDLTQTDGASGARLPQTPAKFSRHVVIDLVTPRKRGGTLESPKGNKSQSAGRENQSSALDLPIDDLEPAEKLVAQALARLDESYLSDIFSLVIYTSPEKIRHGLIARISSKKAFPVSPYNTKEKRNALIAYTLLRLFETHKSGVSCSLARLKKLIQEGELESQDLNTQQAIAKLNSFIEFLGRLSDRFHWKRDPTKMEGLNSTDIENSEEDGSDDGEASVRKRRRRKKIIRNREAADLRETDRARMVEQDHRRQVLRAKLQQLEASGAMDLGSRNIINESKSDDQGLIYVHHEIAQHIKDHQVRGVRFMWDQIVGSTTGQGCLLAHTMGLGKTMQIVTLLVAIAQAAGSDDPTISSQIPDKMKESRTLVLCPPTLVNNWIDELLFWSPEKHELGEFFKMDQSIPADQRDEIIQAWDSRGGVLVIGYYLFKQFAGVEDIFEILTNSPNLVVADEAHMLKNPKSQLHVTTANFRTHSRIALTGSPLANNVEEYHAMINWVAPNYLSDLREFRSEYSGPITRGLLADSPMSDRRMALKMLRVLKKEVAPKVQRVTISVLKHDIPTKQEFVLTVPLTPIQREAYEAYIRYHQDNPSGARTFASVGTLGLLCAHPCTFMKKLEDQKASSAKGAKKAGEASVTLPEQLVSNEMTLLRKERDLNAFSLSWRIPMLLVILDECKRLGDSVLLFTHSIGTLDYLEQILRKRKCSFERLDGQTPMANRQTMVKDFNKNQIDVFLISTRAGGLGLNITGANRVIIFDSQFNPQHEQQAVGRAYRIGQKKPVCVYRFVCGGTYEEKLLNQAIWKMQLASRVVDRKNPIPKAQRFGQAFEMPIEPEQKDLDEHTGKDSVLDKVIETHRPGIRAITMMDTFEEEELEDAVLTAEDRAEADRLIAQNEARRLGLPIPSGVTNGVSVPILRASAETSGGTSIDVPVPREGVETPKNKEYKSNDVPSLHAPLQPIPGTTTRIRENPQPQDQALLLNQAAFRGEVTRCIMNTGSDRATSELIADRVVSVIWSGSEDRKRAILAAVQSRRFALAILLGLVSPMQLAEMEASEILAKQREFDALLAPEWEAMKPPGTNLSKSSSGAVEGVETTDQDPQHLRQALHRMSFTLRDSDPIFTQHKPHRVDDQKALEAVMERRKAKQSSLSKDPRLPGWAIDAVARQGRGTTPSSSSTAPASTLRPLPKTPFR